jgi:uncharacterized protein
MNIYEIIWPKDRIEHIARHSVSPEEFEEVCFSRSLVLKAKSQGANPVYYVLGQTNSGRYLFCVVIQFPGGKAYPVTARSMTDKEKIQIPAMENTMNTIPKTDCIQELAEFWDSHDITDFFDELEEVTEPVFIRDTVMEVHLSSDEAETVRKIAKFQGIGVTDLIHNWIVEQAHLIQQQRKIV